MGEALKEFFIVLGLDADASSFASAQSMVDLLEKGLQKMVEWAERAFSAFEDAVIGTAKYGSALDDASKKTGLTTQALEEFTYASQLSGGSSESFQNGLVHLARKMGEVKNGSKEATEAFAKLGVRVTDGSGKFRTWEDVVNDSADAISKMPEGIERMVAAQSVFGKSGADMIPVLAGGSAELKRLREEYRLTVGTLTSGQVQMLDKFDDSLVTLRAFGAQVVREFAMPIVQALQPIIDKTLVWIRANRQLITDTATRWGERFASVLTSIAKGIGYVADHVDDIVQGLKLIAIAVVSIGTAVLVSMLPALIESITWFGALSIAAVASAVAAIDAWLAAAAPFILLAAAIGLVLLVLDDLFVFLKGGDSLLGHILNNYWTQIEAFLTKVRVAIHAAGFGPQLELALAGFEKLSLAVGDAVSPEAPETPAEGHPYAPPNWNRELAPKVSDYVSAPQSAATSSSSSSTRTQVSVPVQMTVVAAPGQSTTEIATDAARQIRDFVVGEFRKAADSITD